MDSIRRKKGLKAVGLLSGGLDSTLAAKLILEQGIEISAINFTSPFCTCTPKKSGCAAVITAVRQLGDVPLRRTALGDEYLDMVQNPKHGYGSGLNPCIDCRIMKIRKAGEYMHEIGASFLFTGEVLGQRPMSQHRQAIELIDRESGLQGHILRPLSAAHFEPTIPEKRGWIDRSKLLGISGRSRKEQISLATEKGIRDYPCPAGGCLLTDKNFADRMGDYFTHTETASMKDIPLLKVGRHFRLENGDKVIVARNEQECKTLKKICPDTDHSLTPVNFSGPVVVFQGTSLEAAVEKMLEYTKRKISEDARIAHRFGGKNEIIRLPRVPLPLIRQPKVVSAIRPH
jgi:tRNA U34 2-thiouridine synthase MnmA/TrmU